MKAALLNKLCATISRNIFSSKEISKVVPSSIFHSVQEVSREMVLELPTYHFQNRMKLCGLEDGLGSITNIRGSGKILASGIWPSKWGDSIFIMKSKT